MSEGAACHVEHAQALRLTLPWPPSVNTYWRSIVLPKKRHATVLISEQGREYRKTVAWYCSSFTVKNWAEAHRAQPMAVQILAYPPDRRARDLDNILKSLLDSLTHAAVFRDDSDIWDLRVTRACVSAPPGRVMLKIQPFQIGGVDSVAYMAQSS